MPTASAAQFLLFDPPAVMPAFSLRHADRDHLRGIVPFVGRRCHIQALVALQADEAAIEGRAQHLGDLSLADAGLALEKQRPAHAQ